MGIDENIRAAGCEHDDHHLSTRRRFLRQLGLLSAGTALLPGSGLSAVGSASLSEALSNADSDRVLVLIRLKGGNDGLNTIVPLYDYDAYRRARPQLGYRPADLLNLTDELAVPKAFEAAQQQWQAGAMRVVNGVGYPSQSLSHFRGTDIIASASESDEVRTSGWLGRRLGAVYPDYLSKLPEVPPAIQIGGAGSLTFISNENVSLAVNVNAVEDLTRLAERGTLYDTSELPDCAYGTQLGYLRSIANSAFGYAAVIKSAFDRGGEPRVSYPENSLGRQLAAVARLVKGELGTRLYMVTLDGFDTHAAQLTKHAGLLRELGESTQAFFADLATAGLERQVLASTFSEFGRRIEQNGSAGTDHGTAAPQLLFGPALEGNGAVGDAPTLEDPDGNGNLRYTTDFRSVYATLLEDWLCVSPGEVDRVLGGTYERLDLGFRCEDSVSTHEPRHSAESFKTTLRATAAGWALSFTAIAGQYQLHLHDALGRGYHRETLTLPPGEALVPLMVPTAAGVSTYTLQGADGRISSGVVPGVR